MKAPDRIVAKLTLAAIENGAAYGTWLDANSTIPSIAVANHGYEEYVRKGAFPVEEIRDSTMFQLGAASEEDWGKETHKLYRLLTRILSLLEGEQ